MFLNISKMQIPSRIFSNTCTPKSFVSPAGLGLRLYTYMDPKAQSEPKIPGPDPDSDYAAIAKNFVKIFFFLNTFVLCLINYMYNVRVYIHAIPCKRKDILASSVGDP